MFYIFIEGGDEFKIISMIDGKEPSAVTTRRKINDGLQRSYENANAALMTGVETIGRLKQQFNHLSNANNNLNPLVSSGEMSLGISNEILKNLTSGRNMFIICAVVFVILIYLVIRWKHS